MRTFEDTVRLMVSDDELEQMAGEYFQAEIRLNNLFNAILNEKDYERKEMLIEFLEYFTAYRNALGRFVDFEKERINKERNNEYSERESIWNGLN